MVLKSWGLKGSVLVLLMIKSMPLSRPVWVMLTTLGARLSLARRPPGHWVRSSLRMVLAL